jgi:AcrR family transcriptional regulator
VGGTDGPRPGGLRERKKQLTRQALLAAAERLFEQRGYDNVTVAEIADAANISVKTLFTYFASKEDLAFGGEARLRDELVVAIIDRPARTSVLDAVTVVLRRQIDAAAAAGEATAGMAGYHRGYGDSAALQSRLRRMWHDYEDALTAAIDRSTAGLTPAEARLLAMRAIVLVRSLTTTEVRDLVAAADDPQAALHGWLDQAARTLAGATGRLPGRRRT